MSLTVLQKNLSSEEFLPPPCPSLTAFDKLFPNSPHFALFAPLWGVPKKQIPVGTSKIEICALLFLAVIMAFPAIGTVSKSRVTVYILAVPV